MSAETVLRYAMVACASDPRSPLSAPWRQWVQRRLREQRPLAPRTVARLLPDVLAWADAQAPSTGQALRQALGLADAANDPQASGLTLLAMYPGQATRDAAAALAGVMTTDEQKPETKGILL